MKVKKDPSHQHRDKRTPLWRCVAGWCYTMLQPSTVLHTSPL